MALDLLGQQPISSMSQTTGNGPLLTRTYYQQRDALLRETHWTFARSEIALTLLNNNIWQNWEYAYQYPTDCLKIQYLMNPNLSPSVSGTGYPWGPMTWEMYQRDYPHEVTDQLDSNNNATGQKAILSNMDNAYLVYTKAITDTALFPATFIDALVLRIAKTICHRLLPNSPILNDLKGEYEKASAVAKRDASNESVEWANRPSSIEQYRR